VVCFHLRQWRWWWLRFRVCNVFDVFNLRKHIQVLDWIYVSNEFTLLR
jgi:hypothetical protein